jgi:hypothetical protein
MLLKTSKVKSVQANGTWESKATGDTYYKFEVEMEDGNIGEYSSKSKDQIKFVVGQETEYEYHGGKFPKIKPHYNKGNFTGGSKGGYTDADKMRMAKSVAIKSACIFLQQKEAKKEDVKAFADFCYNYITKEETVVNKDNIIAGTDFTGTMPDDLPF